MLSKSIAVLLSSACALFAVAGAPVAHAAYPTRQITLVLPFPPGGIVDPVARLVATKLSERLGQPVVVENKAGAGGAIAAQQVKNAVPDGHTILLHSNAIAIHPALSRSPLYNIRTDFTPIGQVAFAPYLIVTGGQSSVRSLKEVLAFGKANPGKINYGTSGIGSSTHLATELLALQAGIEMTHVPYNGEAPMYSGLFSNEVMI